MKADDLITILTGKVDIANDRIEGDEEKLDDVLFELESSHDELVTPYDATARNGRNKRPFLGQMSYLCISPEGFLLPVLLVVVIIVTVVIVIVILIVVVDDVSLILKLSFTGKSIDEYLHYVSRRWYHVRHNSVILGIYNAILNHVKRLFNFRSNHSGFDWLDPIPIVELWRMNHKTGHHRSSSRSSVVPIGILALAMSSFVLLELRKCHH
ncbi:hypothetical protein Tco_1015788 [Tanacetum coccineum]|uniref:Uncharacterized protein n=1 Tax=Tanacetum coccineum TaxID=301880 RepID=A0ABQ5FN44_9ASTR